ncbi:hypothetical protein SAMN05216404_107128 [Nitrosospira multiformis]|uniref:Uncharacterized protein n=1 Tax=Nitrosospira multiformis TaxID=1231 RepID=A0A1H8JPC4_9PROT|nr:hypothetical protein [Nitrosospira multiformis]SEN82176.1 hypothetical protein SAMN05216404_107128 [Nitrosospira multiformis]
MTNSKKASKDEYDKILHKLEILLSRHQDVSSTPLADSDSHLVAGSPRLSGTAMKQVRVDDIPTLTEVATRQPPSGADIPTLTEVVHSAPSTLSPADITVLLEKILDGALNETSIVLNPDARKALIQALKSRLFGL